MVKEAHGVWEQEEGQGAMVLHTKMKDMTHREMHVDKYTIQTK